MHVAETIANANFRRYNGSMPRDELIACAYYGLTRAARTYSSTLGATFKTFASMRIQGEIKDRWRKDYGRLGGHRRATHIESISDEFINDDRNDKLLDVSDLPEAFIEKEHVTFLVQAAMSKLDEREQNIVKMYHFEGKRFHTIGKILSISESRTVQIYHGALAKMRPVVEALR